MQISDKYLIVPKKLEEIGSDLRKGFGNTKEIKRKDGHIYSVVTKYDQKTEHFLHDALKKKFPEIGFEGEEFGKRSKNDTFWLMDPIDGTIFFLRGIPFCTSMIALISDGKPIFSAIYNFVTKEMFLAEKGKGSYLNGKKIHVSTRRLNESSIFFDSSFKNKKDLKNVFKLKEKSIVFDSFVGGWEFAMVAQGKIEGRVALDPFGKDWDYAPGAFLVEEAGGVVANIGSREYDYKNHNFIASNKEVFEDLTSGVSAMYPIK